MVLLPFTYELTTDRGVKFTTIECEVDAEWYSADRASITAVWIDDEDLFRSSETALRAIACLIAGDAEKSPFIIDSLREEAADRRLEREVA